MDVSSDGRDGEGERREGVGVRVMGRRGERGDKVSDLGQMRGPQDQ